VKHEVKVVRLGPIRKHDNADTLGITEIDGYTVVVRLAEWKEGDLGVYVEPDYIVPEAPWSSFLNGHRRIKVKKLRGVFSQGLLLSLSTIWPESGPLVIEGDNVMESLGIVRYEPPEEGEPGFQRVRNPGEKPHPSLANMSKYDLESWQKYQRLIAPGTVVSVTEKINGENARYAWRDGRMWCGSRMRWVPADENGGQTSWWVALRENPWIEEWCKREPEMVLFGEVFGNIPKMAYGVPAGSRRFLAFDAFDTTRGAFVDASIFALCTEADHRAPMLYWGPVEGCDPKLLAEGKTTVKGANHVREGCVIKPVSEQWNERTGRVALKCVGNGYLEKE